MKNENIRLFIKQSGLKHWQVAKALGIGESTFVRWLREELPETEKEKILAIISEVERGEKND